ncbi:MAG: ParB/RepB/Spo0J family partition protein [Clostridiales bacterium]|jgi:ParB family chromosome partitioning protein|nr:ParB/RepB/Spo0J family partition protein [Clostridiales bacterium]
MAAKKGGLGKGLDAIFMENATEDSNHTITLKVSEIEPNRTQPRKEFSDEAMAELADSISRHGVLQPLLVRPLAGGGYQIVAGERRWRACRMAGVSEVPVVIRDLSDSEVMELALIENLQREDLSPVEEALGYHTLIDQYQFTQDEVSKTVGKSRPAVTNALRLLSLPQDLLELVGEGKLSAGHGRTLLAFPDEESMREAAKLAVEQGISVRQLEKLAKKAGEPPSAVQADKKSRRNTFYDEVELSLNEHLGRRVKVNNKAKNKGVLEIEFYSQEDLTELARLLGGDD